MEELFETNAKVKRSPKPQKLYGMDYLLQNPPKYGKWSVGDPFYNEVIEKLTHLGEKQISYGHLMSYLKKYWISE